MRPPQRQRDTLPEPRERNAATQWRRRARRVAAGAATRSDSLRASIQVGTAQLAVITAGNTLAATNANLSRLVGSNTTVTAIASDTSVVATISMSDAELLEIVERGPSVRQSEAVLAAAKPPLAITHSPGCMFVTDVVDDAVRTA